MPPDWVGKTNGRYTKFFPVRETGLVANVNASSQFELSGRLQEPRLGGAKLHRFQEIIILILTYVLLYAMPTTEWNSPTSVKPRVRGGSRCWI